MQFGQFLSTVNSPHCHTNGQSSVQHGRQRWTVHGEHVRQLTHVVFDRKDWKKAAYGRVPDPAEGQSPAVLDFLVFLLTILVTNTFSVHRPSERT